jgi:phosphatidylethanolamine/phosphatidyl-N-methylethanolamine N-methyltransferase
MTRLAGLAEKNSLPSRCKLSFSFMSSLTFARQALKNWREVGAVAPSSPRLGARMAEVAEVWRADRVVELGPGTGALTAPVLDAMPHSSQYLGLELNPQFVQTLRQRHPGHHFETADAQEFDFASLWPDDPSFDVVISGLPWTSFPDSLQIDILDHVLPRLRPGGRFATFAYWGFHLLPNGRRFRRLLHSRLAGVESSRVLWGNLPPAFIYVGRVAG